MNRHLAATANSEQASIGGGLSHAARGILQEAADPGVSRHARCLWHRWRQEVQVGYFKTKAGDPLNKPGEGSVVG